MTNDILIAILATSVMVGTPILFASLGEILTERAGILNLGVEGVMLVGAVSGFAVALFSHNPWLGVTGAMLAGGALALAHAVLSVTLKANQVVSGLALALFGAGLSGYLGKSLVGIPLPVKIAASKVPLLGDIPFLGPVLFQQDGMVYLGYLLAPALWYLLFRTRTGLSVRAVGENPGAADALGISVSLTRYACTIAGGMLAGAGGAYLSLAYAPAWLENMTAGRGWIAIALVIFAAWNPLYALAGAYLFGGIDALSLRLQAMNVTVSPFFLRMLPYLFTLLVLVLVTRKSTRHRFGAPKALGLPYEREER
ncbi:Branched-chain amino acid transport system / permease component [Pelotomaculum sp. FP]|uniref:ABC transporter permease n=1 Tax=Pelotomaculum sp. FP TaxID=261474 RepID=UPI001065926F|nr:ABC transporter permease [Pelotomaculum sp. FP]TEB14537.1 Branched-chain amino acid transport system / permease component [Pelotomaculum sp. FP]